MYTCMPVHGAHLYMEACVCIYVCHLQVSVDSLSWEFHVSHLDDSNLTEPPKVCMLCTYMYIVHVCIQSY